MLQIKQGYGKYIAYSEKGYLTPEEFSQFTRVVNQVENQFDRVKKRYLDCLGPAFECGGPESVSRHDMIVFLLQELQIPLKPIFVPQTLYDILTTFSIDDPSEWDEELRQKKIFRPEPFHQDALSSIEARKKMDPHLESMILKLALKTNLIANLIFKAKGVRGDLTLAEIQELGIYCFFSSPWFQNIWRPYMKNSSDQEGFKLKLKRSLEIECHANPGSVVIYRGSDRQSDSLKNKSPMDFSKCSEDGVVIPCGVHSLSFGQSFIAGAAGEQQENGASPFVYCLKSPSCYALEIKNPKEQQLFYLPSRDLQMLSIGEFFHARTKLPSLSYRNFEESRSFPIFWSRAGLNAESLKVSGFWHKNRISRKDDLLFANLTYPELEKLWNQSKEGAIELNSKKAHE